MSNYLTPRKRAILSHRLRHRQSPDGKPFKVVENELSSLKLDEPLPNPAKQADNLIQWIGDNQSSQSEPAVTSEPFLSAWIGSPITPNSANTGLDWLLKQGEVTKLLDFSREVWDAQSAQGLPKRLCLNFVGWQRYEALKRVQIESRTAFMAMKFGDSQLAEVFNCHFKDAVAATGFELRDLTEGQPAGSIDDQLRVGLRTARFMIADLTHDNNGASWEAGFAEGLGSPVIYTCRQDKWEADKSHFDTNHLNTIIWEPEKLPDAAKRLTATIRNTLPNEAKMTD
jgi:nucleoside 2-deoxyribosyltransferase